MDKQMELRINKSIERQTVFLHNLSLLYFIDAKILDVEIGKKWVEKEFKGRRIIRGG